MDRAAGAVSSRALDAIDVDGGREVAAAEQRALSRGRIRRQIGACQLEFRRGRRFTAGDGLSPFLLGFLYAAVTLGEFFFGVGFEREAPLITFAF